MSIEELKEVLQVVNFRIVAMETAIANLQVKYANESQKSAEVKRIKGRDQSGDPITQGGKNGA